MTTGRISAQGRALVPAQPDELQLEMKLTFLASTPEGALSEVAERSQELDRLFEELGIEQGRRISSGVAVNDEREYEKDKIRHKGYRATSRVVVRLSDAGIASRLIGAATRRVEAQIDGSYWRVAPNNPAREEACRQAAVDARSKAEAYAQALGVRLGALLRVGDPGSVAYGRREMLTFAQESLAASDVHIETGEMDVGATVEVTFQIELG